MININNENKNYKIIRNKKKKKKIYANKHDKHSQ